MARPSKLTDAQCKLIRALHDDGVKAPTLTKTFKISESSVYKILNGSYIAASSPEHILPPLVTNPESHGSTPSLFYNDGKKNHLPQVSPEDRAAAARILRAADACAGEPVDEVTLAAAELILAQARYARAVSNSR